MKYIIKRILIITTILFVLQLSGCANDKASYVIDFENLDNIDYTIACFNETYTERFLSFDSDVKGFKGNVFKAKVREPEPNDTWWVCGIKFKNDDTIDESLFYEISKISFDYSSSVDYSGDTQFMIQMVWKEQVNEMEVASVWVDFPIKNTNGEVVEFDIEIDDKTKKALQESTDYYLDWIMIGLESGANEDFNEGTFYIDNIRFLKE